MGFRLRRLRTIGICVGALIAGVLAASALAGTTGSGTRAPAAPHATSTLSCPPDTAPPGPGWQGPGGSCEPICNTPAWQNGGDFGGAPCETPGNGTGGCPPDFLASKGSPGYTQCTVLCSSPKSAGEPCVEPTTPCTKATVSGRVTDQAGQGVGGVTIRGAGAKTNASGRYSGRECKARDLGVFPRGEKVLAVTACHPGKTAGKQCDLDTDHGSGVASFRVRRQLTISGTVLGVRGHKRLANVVVVATSGGRTYRTSTDSNGHFRLSVPAAGHYAVRTVGLAHSVPRFCLPGHIVGTVCQLTLTHVGVVAFRVVEPKMVALYDGAEARCQAEEMIAPTHQSNSLPVLKPADCKHPALLGGEIHVLGEGFPANRTVKLRWFSTDEFSPGRARNDKPFAQFEARTDERGRFEARIEAKYWLDGTCATKLIAEQGHDRSEDVIEFRPQFVVNAFPAITLLGHDFRAGFLCTVVGGAFWPNKIRDGVHRGDQVLAQEIHDFNEGQPVDGALATSGGPFWIWSIAHDGRRISCEDCSLSAGELQFQVPDGRSATIESENTLPPNNIWTFSGPPVTQPFGFVPHCPPAPQTAVFATPHDVTGSSCEEYGNGAHFNGGLTMGSQSRVLANSLIQVKGGLRMGDGSDLVAATDKLIIEGGINASNVALGANGLIKLAY